MEAKMSYQVLDVLELNDLRRKHEHLLEMQKKREGAPDGADELEEETEEDEDDYDDEVVGELPQKGTPVDRKPRTSVSAEAFGSWNKKEAFEAPVIAKSDESKEKI